MFFIYVRGTPQIRGVRKSPISYCPRIGIDYENRKNPSKMPRKELDKWPMQ
jgi:hypothetical protein